MSTTNKSSAGSPRFWTMFAPIYVRQPVVDEASYQRKLKETRERFPENAQVLELGCGTGSTALAHAPYAGHIIATDFAQGMIAQAEKKRRRARVKNVEFRVGTAEGLDFPPESFDAVLALNLLHLVADPAAILRDIAEVLKPGGFLAASTMAMGDKFAFLKPISRLLPVKTNFFSEDQHRADVTAASLEIELDWTPGPKAATFIIARKTTR